MILPIYRARRDLKCSILPASTEFFGTEEFLRRGQHYTVIKIDSTNEMKAAQVLEAILLNMFFDDLFQASNIVFILPFHTFPEGGQLFVVFSVNDVLVVAPQRVQTLTEIVDHVMVMIRRACRFTDVPDLFLCRECHNYSPFIGIVFFNRSQFAEDLDQ